MHVKTRLIARLLGRPSSTLTLEANTINMVGNSGASTTDISNILSVNNEPSLIWTNISITTSDGLTTAHCGFPKRAATRALAYINLIARDSSVSALLEEFSPDHRYLTHSLHQDWLSRATAVASQITVPIDERGLPTGPLKQFRRLHEILQGGETMRQARNEEYVGIQKRKHAQLLNNLLGFSLNQRQVSAILHDEDRALVVAGAGTGKTSTIIGKTTYLLKEGLAKPNEVLLLAFTDRAAKEMASRLTTLSEQEITVKTFHALGLHAIAKATGKKPSVSKLAGDDSSLRLAIKRFLDVLLEAPHHRDALAEFLAYFRYPYRSADTFQSQHQYLQHIAGHNVKTLRGERVKSMEECSIANWLTLHNIKYEYESDYKHDTASIEFRQYQPDFYLLEFDIYIEHFGINKNGQPPPFFGDPNRYLLGTTAPTRRSTGAAPARRRPAPRVRRSSRYGRTRQQWIRGSPAPF